MKRALPALALAFTLSAPGCAVNTNFAYTNVDLGETRLLAPKASFYIDPAARRPTKRHRDVLVLLALSGGGSRAAYFSARTMLALRDVAGPDGRINVLDEVELISAVSGGSLAAALYATSVDPGEEAQLPRRLVWDEKTLADLLGRNYLQRWVSAWLRPTNVAKFWFTPFDRTDIMAQTFADNLFDRPDGGTDWRMAELNPARPNIVLNATIGSRSYEGTEWARAKPFGTVFTFTAEDFATKLRSGIGDYKVARAVMASATFPAAFNFMTLRNYNREECPPGKPECYIHVFDGGNSDNSGLLSLKRVLLEDGAALLRSHKRVVVIFVDAFRDSGGADIVAPDPRRGFDYLVDTNFIDATDSLLEVNRARTLEQYFARSIADYSKPEQCRRDNLPPSACVVAPDGWPAGAPNKAQLERLVKEKLFFFHVNFDAVDQADFRRRLHEIPTTFLLEPGQMQAIELGVGDIFTNASNTFARECVTRLGVLIARPEGSVVVEGNPWCGGIGREARERREALQKK